MCDATISHSSFATLLHWSAYKVFKVLLWCNRGGSGSTNVVTLIVFPQRREAITLQQGRISPCCHMFTCVQEEVVAQLSWHWSCCHREEKPYPHNSATGENFLLFSYVIHTNTRPFMADTKSTPQVFVSCLRSPTWCLYREHMVNVHRRIHRNA